LTVLTSERRGVAYFFCDSISNERQRSALILTWNKL